MSEYLITPVLTADDASEFLASFLVYIEHPLFRGTDHADYSAFCLHYLESRGLLALPDPPRSNLTWCDLCGRQFETGPLQKTETMTGNHFLWCHDCCQQQQVVLDKLGPVRYRELWRQQEEAEAIP